VKAEIVGVGTELLLGQIANTNARTISEALASIGVDVHFHQAVGDNPQRMHEAFSLAAQRSDVVIVTGGLGPTPDDITREAIADLAGVPLVRRDDLAMRIQAVFKKLGREMPEDNLRQADLPEGAEPIDPQGTAPGFRLDVDGCTFFALPGVPWEMEAMLYGDVLPYLRQAGGASTIVSREILVMGLGESHTHERIADIVERQTQPTIAYLAGSGRVRVRLTAKAGSEAEALALIEPVEREIRERLGKHAVEGTTSDLAQALGEILRAKNITVACAESLTGGSLGAELSGAGGSSDFFKGGIVTYWTEAKRDVLGVDESVLLGPGAVSEEAAAAMAQAAAMRFEAELGLATTGVAGPSEQEGKPVGTIFVGAAFAGTTQVRQVRGYGNRANIRAIAVSAAMDLGRRLVLETDGD
jgi:nicotinamide-nucleotide amidase